MGMGIARIVVIHQIFTSEIHRIVLTCPQALDRSQVSLYHTISADTHKTEYQLMPFVINYNYTTLSLFNAHYTSMLIHSCLLSAGLV